MAPQSLRKKLLIGTLGVVLAGCVRHSDYYVSTSAEATTVETNGCFGWAAKTEVGRGVGFQEYISVLPVGDGVRVNLQLNFGFSGLVAISRPVIAVETPDGKTTEARLSSTSPLPDQFEREVPSPLVLTGAASFLSPPNVISLILPDMTVSGYAYPSKRLTLHLKHRIAVNICEG